MLALTRVCLSAHELGDLISFWALSRLTLGPGVYASASLMGTCETPHLSTAHYMLAASHLHWLKAESRLITMSRGS